MKKLISILIALFIGTFSVFADTVWFWRGSNCIKVENAVYDDSFSVEFVPINVKSGRYHIDFSNGILYIKVDGKVYKTTMYTVERSE